MVSITSLGMVAPGTYDAGSGTTLVSATEEMREKRTASVVVSACGRSPGSSAGCSSVCEWTSRVGGQHQDGHVAADFHGRIEDRVVMHDKGDDGLRAESGGYRVGHEPRVVAASLDRRPQSARHRSDIPHASILHRPLPCAYPRGENASLRPVAAGPAA